MSLFYLIILNLRPFSTNYWGGCIKHTDKYVLSLCSLFEALSNKPCHLYISPTDRSSFSSNTCLRNHLFQNWNRWCCIIITCMCTGFNLPFKIFEILKSVIVCRSYTKYQPLWGVYKTYRYPFGQNQTRKNKFEIFECLKHRFKYFSICCR